jgi:uncharacterized protein YjbJ (UPF0337 family)
MSDTPVPATPVSTPENDATPQSVLRGNWGEQREKLKTQFPTLVDADLRYEKGKKDEMLMKVQAKLGKTKEEFNTIMTEL